MQEAPDIEEEFVQLVVNHQPALHAFVLSLLPGHPEADDVVQDVNIALWKKRGEFQLGTELFGMHDASASKRCGFAAV